MSKDIEHINLKNTGDAWDIYIRIRNKDSRLIDVDTTMLDLDDCDNESNLDNNPFSYWNDKRLYRTDFQIVLVDPNLKEKVIGNIKTTYVPKNIIISLKNYLLLDDIYTDNLTLEKNLFSQLYYDSHEMKKLIYYFFTDHNYETDSIYDEVLYINCLNIKSEYRGNALIPLVFELLLEVYREFFDINITSIMLNASPLKSEYYKLTNKKGSKMNEFEISEEESELSRIYSKYGFKSWNDMTTYNYMIKKSK